MLRTEDDRYDPAADRSQDEESGQGLAEYALILAFVAIVCIASLQALGNALSVSDGFHIFEMF